MNIMEILSSLQEHNIDLSTLIKSVLSLFNQNTPLKSQTVDTQYYNMPNYDFNTKYHTFGSTMQGTMQSTMQCIVPQKTAISSQNSNKIDFNKLIEVIQLLSPLFSKSTNKLLPQALEKPTESKNQSEILSLTKVEND